MKKLEVVIKGEHEEEMGREMLSFRIMDTRMCLSGRIPLQTRDVFRYRSS